MSETNREIIEERMNDGESVLDFFHTDTVLTIDRLADRSSILNLSAVAFEAVNNVQTLQAKTRQRTPLTGEKTRRIVGVLRRRHLEPVAY